jgi:hypothetical protein
MMYPDFGPTMHGVRKPGPVWLLSSIQSFLLSFTTAQVKQKEQDLKKEYRLVKDL